MKGEVEFMRYSEIGGMKSSKIILGTDYYGLTVSKREAFSLLDAYCAAGGNHIDTAKIYGEGHTEPLIGEWLRMHGRDGLIVATKGAHPEIGHMDVSRLSHFEIETDLDESLIRLGVDCIDLYWLHRDDEAVDCGGIVETMNELVKKGKIRRFGCSNWKSRRIAEANDYAVRHGLSGFCASQIKFSPAVTAPSYSDDPTLVEMNGDEFEFYKNAEIPVMAFAPQAKGFFSKLAILGERGLSGKVRDRYLCDENLKRFEIIKKICTRYSCSEAAAVCASLASLAAPDTFPIIGGKTVGQLTDSLSGADVVLDSMELKEIFGF